MDVNNRARLLTGSTPEPDELLGNLDLLGTELLAPLLASGLPLPITLALSHRPIHGAAPPKQPLSGVSGRTAVKQCLKDAGMNVDNAARYTRARVDLFGAERLAAHYHLHQTGQASHCEVLCRSAYGQQSPHTLLEALLQLKRRGLPFMCSQGFISGGLRRKLRVFCTNHQLNGQVNFLPQLNRDQLARFSN